MSIKRNLILIFIVIFLANLVFAQEYKHLEEGEPAPFAGTLLSPEAMATIVAKKENCKKETKLESDLQCNKEKEKIKRDKSQLQVEKETAQKEKEIIEKIKNQEIERLQEIIDESPNDYSSLFFAGGILSGITLSLIIFYISVQTVN